MFERLKQEMRNCRFDFRHLPTLSVFSTCAEFELYLKNESKAWRGLRVALVRDGVVKNFFDDRGKLSSDFDASLAVILQNISDKASGAQGDRQNRLQPSAGEGFVVFDWTLHLETGFAPSEDLARFECAQRLRDMLEREEIDVVVASGSGSLTDVAKYAAFLSSKKPAVWSIPTALTVTAYTSAFAVLETGGYKKTYPSLMPAKTIFLNFVTRCAPFALRQAGVGDLLAGFTSYADWYLSSAFSFSHDFLPEVAQFMMRYQRLLLKPTQPDPLSDQSYNDGVVTLISELLAAAGLAMNLGKSSAPQSGGEHATSHALDWLRNVSGRQKWLHGTQVALTALSSCFIFDWIRSLDFVPVAWLAKVNEQELETIVKDLIDEAPYHLGLQFLTDRKEREQWLASHQDVLSNELSQALHVARQKAAQWGDLRQRFSSVQHDWPKILAELASLTLTAEEYFCCLQSWGLPDVVENMQPPGRLIELRWALRFAVFYRARFGAQDFAFWVGEDPAVAAAL